MKTFRFFDFPVYCQSKNFYKRVLVISLRVKDYSFRDQIKRATLSIVLNIAEGSAKESDKDFARFLGISIASANEVAACLEIMYELDKFSVDEYKSIMEELEDIVKQLGGFIKKLKNS